MLLPSLLEKPTIQSTWQVAGPLLDGLRGMSSLLLESEDAGYLLQVCVLCVPC